MATEIKTLTNDAELKTKCEEATKYGEKKTGRVYFKTQEEQEKACLYLDFFLCYHAIGFQDNKGFGLKFRRQY